MKLLSDAVLFMTFDAGCVMPDSWKRYLEAVFLAARKAYQLPLLGDIHERHYSDKG